MSGIVAIGKAIPTMGALVKLDIHNNFLMAKGCKVLADALRENDNIQELNIAPYKLGSSGSYADRLEVLHQGLQSLAHSEQ